MLKIYDKNNNFIKGITDYKEARTEQELNITDTLLFSVPKDLGDLFEEEGYIETKEGRFVIKEKNLIRDGYEIVGKYDLEDLLDWVESESYITEDIITMGEDLLEGTGWQIKYGDEWGRNLFTVTDWISSIGKIDTLERFTGKFWATRVYSQEWVQKKLIPNETYTLSFKAKLLFKPATPQNNTWATVRFRFYEANKDDMMLAGITKAQYDNMKIGDEIEVVTTFITPANVHELAVLLYCPRHDPDQIAEFEFSDVKLEKGNKATDWTPAPEDLTLPKRTVTGTNISVLEFLYKAVDTFKYDIRFDNINKTIYVADELGSDKGVYFHDEVNLKSLTATSDTYDFATRLIPIGFNNMGIELINDGKSYVENHTYSDKIITKYWSDERYTAVENLKEDAEKRLAQICMPLRSYSADVQDLSRNSEYKILAYETGDTITLVDKESDTREKQRIIKKVKYIDEPEKDNVTIANRPRYLGDEQEKIIENLRSSFSITKASLELFEDSIKGRVSTVEGKVDAVEDDYGEFKGQTEATITEHTTEIEAISTEMSTKVSRTVYDQDYNEISNNYTEFKQDFESFRNSVQVGGGSNLIKNSVGYGGTNFWSVENGEIDYGTSTWILQGASKHGWKIFDGIMSQPVNLMPSTDYTLSGKLLKFTQAGTVVIGLYNEDILVYEAINKGEETFDGEFSLQFNTENIANYLLKVSVIGASTVQPVELTDLMLAQGQNYDVWSQASGEMYTLNVKVDGRGIEVYSADGQGRTIMSPEEFAGYYNNRKIFTLNGDITEVMGLYIGEKGLFIPPVKFVQTQNSLDIVWTGR